jgi:hypothetical protein
MDRQTALDLVGGEWWDESKWVELQEDGKVTTQLDETAFTNLRLGGVQVSREALIQAAEDARALALQRTKELYARAADQ